VRSGLAAEVFEVIEAVLIDEDNRRAKQGR